MTLLPLVAGCVLVMHDDGPKRDHDRWDGDDDRTCDDVAAELQSEADAIRACTDAAECGQVLTGTSCGCTRDWVARLDADTTAFDALMDENARRECGAIPDSTCDCPSADGFDCVAGQCTWNYTTDEPLPEDFSTCDGDAGDPYELQSASISGDTLALVVAYGGGCETHEWAICWPDQSFMESYPVQVSLEPYHDGNGDLCDAWLTEAVGFDLSPLREAYVAAYGAETGTIVVHVGTETVDYTF